MALVTWKDLCIDVNDLHASAQFWAETLGLQVVPDEGEAGEQGEVHLEGPTPRHTVWPCIVPEPKSVKDRVHVDVHAASSVLPGTTRLSAEGEFPWTVTLGAGSSIADLEAAGPRVLRRPDDEVSWTVMADPDGNEFCVFGEDVA